MKDTECRTDEELIQCLIRDDWDFTKEELDRIEKLPKICDYENGEGVEMVVEDI